VNTDDGVHAEVVGDVFALALIGNTSGRDVRRDFDAARSNEPGVLKRLGTSMPSEGGEEQRRCGDEHIP
jgi:hypothetical protein